MPKNKEKSKNQTRLSNKYTNYITEKKTLLKTLLKSEIDFESTISANDQNKIKLVVENNGAIILSTQEEQIQNIVALSGLLDHKNEATTEDYQKMVKLASALPVEILLRYHEDIKRKKLAITKIERNIEEILSCKFEQQIIESLEKEAKQSGVVNIVDGDYYIKTEISKKIEWDQQIIQSVFEDIPQVECDSIKGYFNVTAKIDEKNFAKLPDNLKQAFNKARKITFGKPKIVTYQKLQQLKGEC